MENKTKIITIVGPTASKKSDLAVEIARKFNGEIISADSRQVYKGLDIGTGKITKKEMSGIPHHMLDVISPKKIYTVNDYKITAQIILDNIIERNKLPIICGGAGFYIQSLVDGVTLPEVRPNKRLRETLEKKTALDLTLELEKKDPERAGLVDQKNKRRIIRALEIIETLGKVPMIRKSFKYKTLFIGLYPKNLKRNIHNRLLKRVRQGMIQEARHLHKKGLSYKRMEELGLEYKFLARHLKGELSKKETIRQLETAINQYAKRQMSWFKKDKRIKWLSKPEEIEVIVAKFLFER